MVVFGEAVRPKGRLEFGKMQIVEFANVCVDVGAHDEFRFHGEFVEEGVKCVEETEVSVVISLFGARVVYRGKGKGELFIALLPLHSFTNLIIAGECHVYANEASCKFFCSIGCDGGPSSRGFPSLVVAWQENNCNPVKVVIV